MKLKQGKGHLPLQLKLGKGYTVAFLDFHLAVGSSVSAGGGTGGRSLRLHCNVNVFANTEVNCSLIGRSKAVFAESYCAQSLRASMRGN